MHTGQSAKMQFIPFIRQFTPFCEYSLGGGSILAAYLLTTRQTTNMKLNLARFLIPALLVLGSVPAIAQSLQERLDRLSADYAAANVNAVVLVGDRNGIVYEKAFGYADMDKKLPLTVSTRFKTESVGKFFTSTRVMQLIEQGKLKPTDRAAQYLKGWNVPDLDKITVHQLLSHTAGMASPWDHPSYDFAKAYTPAEMKRIIEEVKPVARPGEKYYYSNSGYYLLGEIIAAVTGKSYEDDLRANIFNPAGMAKTGHLGATTMPADAAQPYIFLSSRDYRPFLQGVSPKAMAAGGWVSDAHELYAFARTYLNGKYIDKKTMSLQWTANGAEDLSKSANHYSYGTEVFASTYVPGKNIVGHSGGGGGFSVDMFFEPESGYVAIVMSNMYGMNRAVSSNYLAAALGLPTQPAAQRNTVRAVDHLLLKGVAYFEQDVERFFSEINVPKHGEGFMREFADFLTQLDKPEMARAVLRNVKPTASAKL